MARGRDPRSECASSPPLLRLHRTAAVGRPAGRPVGALARQRRRQAHTRRACARARARRVRVLAGPRARTAERREQCMRARGGVCQASACVRASVRACCLCACACLRALAARADSRAARAADAADSPVRPFAHACGGVVRIQSVRVRLRVRARARAPLALTPRIRVVSSQCVSSAAKLVGRSPFIHVRHARIIIIML